MLAKWLALDPKVLILDEPTRGIDVGSKEQIYTLVRSLADNGTAVIVISSELVEVLGLSDRILVMADGRIVGELAHDDASEEAVLRLITSRVPHTRSSSEPANEVDTVTSKRLARFAAGGGAVWVVVAAHRRCTPRSRRTTSAAWST